ncbi:hypothetical protein WAF17_14195 [Bernardetia sp. ABR2-2B]|uniref:hypothetical protein n=1 Tax=Bernardetia sp. ABR2-2B TaxID=3127472 RepID=UPI0030D24B6C
MNDFKLIISIDFYIEPNTLGFIVANEVLNSTSTKKKMGLITNQIYNSIEKSAINTDNLTQNAVNFINKLIFLLEDKKFAINISKLNSELPTINITLHFEGKNLSQKLEKFLDKIILNYNQLEQYGLSQEIGEIDLMLWNYYNDSILLSKTVLDRILFLHKGFPSLSTNSSSNDCQVEIPNEYCNYDQLIFSDVASNEEMNSIIALWKEKSKNKYSSNQQWNKNIEKKKLILSLGINDYMNYTDYCVLFSDLIKFSNHLKNKFTITFGVYHYAYDGGEIGSETLLELIKNDISLLLTKSLFPPSSNVV